MKVRSLLAFAKVVAVLAFVEDIPARAAEVKVIAGVAMRPAIEQMSPEFAHLTGHSLVPVYGTVTAIRQWIESETAFDVAVFGRASLDLFIEKRKIAAETRTEIARVAMGVGVRKGTPKPDISSVDAFKRSLLKAKSIIYNPEGGVGIHLIGVLERLGIAEQVKAKAIPVTKGVVRGIAGGRGEVGFAFVNELQSDDGVDLVGSLPPEIQRYNELTAGLSTAAEQPAAGRAFIEFLKSTAAMKIMKAQGMDPAHR